MPMSIRNNNAANMVLGEWKKNDKSLAKDLKKAASGMKLNSAEDDASGYSISEKMRTQLRSLNQDIINSQTGASLMHVAEGGIQNIVDELRSLKELAINAANDHNTDADRATLQKEFEQRSADIEDIASSTNYNGKLLLNGNYGTGGSPIRSFPAVNATPDLATVGTISGSSAYTVTKNGLYNIDAAFSGNISIGAGVTEVEFVGPGSTLSDVYISGNTGGNLKLILKNFSTQNTQLKSSIRFAGSNNQLIFKGTNSITMNASGQNKEAIINVGGGLTLQGGDTNGTGTLNIGESWSLAAAIGSDSQQDSSDADITINSGTISLHGSGLQSSFGSADIGSGWRGAIGNITIAGGNISINDNSLNDGACIGSGSGGTAKDIYIGNGANIDVAFCDGAGIGSGAGEKYYVADASVGNITIENATINAHPTSSTHAEAAAIGSGSGVPGIKSGHNNKTTAGNIIIRNSTINASSVTGAAIGSGESSGVGIISIGSGNTIQATSQQGENIGLGVNGYYIAKESPDMPQYDHPLVIHTGTKANQAMHCFLESMDLKHLGIAETKVTTRQKATDALDDIDNAINYALDQQTTVGSYISRLHYTTSNLTTASENTQASESTIRDADMAKTMMDYARDNVLSQSAQAMLAQANQNASSVLSLLQ